MEAFQPLKPPLLKRILGSAFFQISFIFVIVFITIFYIRQKQKEELASRVEFLKGGPTIVEKAFLPNSPQGQTQFSSENSAQHADTQLPPAPPPPPSSGASQSPQGAVPSATATAAITVATTKAFESNQERSSHTKMRLLYAEVDHTTMELLRQEAQASGQYTDFGDFKAGALPATRKITRERGVRILHREEKEFTQSGQSQNWFTGTTPQGGEHQLGFNGIAAIETNSKGVIKGEIEIHSNFRETQDPNDPPISRPYPSTSFELNPGMSWMMSIPLPLISQEGPGRTESDGIFRIFQSPQFKSRQTEFTLFIEFDTQGPK